MTRKRRRKLIRIMKKHHVRRPRLVLREAERAGLALPTALAMLEMETGIPQRNIFGCDHGPSNGSPPYCGQRVTRRRVKKLLRSGMANGVGWTQLTWPAFVLEAERLGGAHKPKNQLRVGFRVLKDNIIREGSVFEGLRAYNGSGAAAHEYAAKAMYRRARWKQRLG